MCSTATSSSFRLCGLIPQLQPSEPEFAAQDSLFKSAALKNYLHASRPKTVLEIDRSAGVLSKVPIARNDGSDPFLKLGGPLNEIGSVEGDYDRSGWWSERLKKLDMMYAIVIGPQDLKKLIIRNDNGYDCYGRAYPISEGLEPRGTKNRVLVRVPASPTGILRPGWDTRMVANGGSELVNTDSIDRAFDSYRTQHVRFRMASSSAKENNFNFFSHNKINFNSWQHIGLENPSGPTTEADSGEDGGTGRLPPSGGKGRLPPSGGRSGGGGKDNDHGDVYDGQFSWIGKVVAEMMEEVASEATKAEKAGAAKKSMGTLVELISRLALLVMSCLIFGTPILADPSLLFKVCIGAQVNGEAVTGSCFSTFAGLLLGVLATCACMMPTISNGFFGQRAYSSLPSSILKGGSPGFNNSLKPHVLTYFYEGSLSGSAELACGLICHAIANLTGNGNAEESEEENPLSFIVKNVFRLGVFLLFAWIPVIGLL